MSWTNNSNNQSDTENPPSTTEKHHKENQRKSGSEPGEASLSPPQDVRTSGTLLLSHLWGKESSEREEKRDITSKSDSSSDDQNKMIEENFPGLLKMLQLPGTLLQGGETPEPRFPREMLPDTYLVYGPSNRHLVPDDKGKTKI